MTRQRESLGEHSSQPTGAPTDVKDAIARLTAEVMVVRRRDSRRFIPVRHAWHRHWCDLPVVNQSTDHAIDRPCPKAGNSLDRGLVDLLNRKRATRMLDCMPNRPLLCSISARCHQPSPPRNRLFESQASATRPDRRNARRAILQV